MSSMSIPCETKEEIVIESINRLTNSGVSLSNINTRLLTERIYNDYRLKGIKCIITEQSIRDIIEPTLKKFKQSSSYSSSYNASRTAALYNIYNSNNNKTKTKLCKSVLMKEPCKYGSKCQFAHSESELSKPKCAFGSACKIRERCPYDHSTSYMPEPMSKSVDIESLKKEAARNRTAKYFNKIKNAPVDKFIVNMNESSEDESSDDEQKI